MFVKITTIALIAFYAIAKGNCVTLDGLSARAGQSLADSFYSMPLNSSSALSAGWTEIEVSDYPDLITLSYYDDPRVILIFDPKSSNVTGIQIGFLVTDVDGIVPIDHSKNPYLFVKTLNGEKYYTGTAFFHQDKEGVRHIEFERSHKTYLHMPTRSGLITNLTSYTQSTCITYMGYHYSEIDENTDCEIMNPWFLLTTSDEIAGIGFLTIGNATSASERTWFETVTYDQLLDILPTAPTCLLEGKLTYNLISLHVWFTTNVVGIGCTDGA